MTEVQKNQQTKDTQPGDIARRDFVALSVAAGLATLRKGSIEVPLASAMASFKKALPAEPTIPRFNRSRATVSSHEPPHRQRVMKTKLLSSFSICERHEGHRGSELISLRSQRSA